MFSVQVDIPAAGSVLVALTGDLDLAASPLFDRELARVVGLGPRHIVVDLRRLTFLDCRGLASVLAARDQARESGVALSVRNVAGTARRIFDLTGASAVFQLAAQRRAAG
jgi:anti-sigma B factor antagonist